MTKPLYFDWLIENQAQLPEILANNPQNRDEKTNLEYQKFLKSRSKEEGLNQIRKEMNGLTTTILSNNFPYNLFLESIPQTKHYCLWTLDKNIEFTEAYNFAKVAFFGHKIAIFENLAVEKTIPEIRHWHVFVDFS